jgi:hypothetical protein
MAVLGKIAHLVLRNELSHDEADAVDNCHDETDGYGCHLRIEKISSRGRYTYFPGALASEFPMKIEFHFFGETEGKEDKEDSEKRVRYNDNVGVQLIVTL